MSISFSCALIRTYSVNPGCVVLRVDTLYTFDPCASGPILELTVRGEFDELTILDALRKIADEELDEITVTDDSVVIQGPFMGEYILKGKTESKQDEYKLSDFAEAYQKISQRADDMHNKLIEARSKITTLECFARSLLARASIKQASFEKESTGWVVHQREIDIINRLIRRLES